MKKIIMLATIAMFTVGCEKQPAAQAQNNAVKTETVKAKAQTDKLTEKELQDLESLEKSPSEETAATAGFYLSNLEVTPVAEIREFIAKGWDEWETLNRQEAEKETQQAPSDQGDASMQYRIEIKNQVFGGKHEVETAYLHLISLSDSITLDRVVVNRGNCRADYRDGANPILYGKSMRFFLNCDPRNVREVVAVLKDGREIVMSPQ
ncbi:hypothetical protein [Acinetobacter guillouiae]|uniref:hypothetical protein n=1 Tax=Acinetobacter guillouiae TaxID=106649 RepID=UPI0028D6CFE5|nr:hypothetical protein [Acinetobacter guillouiae]